MHKTRKTLKQLATLFFIVGGILNNAIAEPGSSLPANTQTITLYFSDGSRPAEGLSAINMKLAEIGVRVSQVDVPDKVAPILLASKHRAVTQAESKTLINAFRLGRRDLIAEIEAAGRLPEMHRGGYLQTSEAGVAPYPKVYDMQALDADTTAYLQRKFGKLHVNSSEAGVGIDEVMTIISGGPYTWFFVFAERVVGKLHFPEVVAGDMAWRISYPGLVPHGGFFDAPHGLVVAYAHGPKQFVMRYDDDSIEGYETLGSNPWIDFTLDNPVLLSKPFKASQTNRQ